jgi:hypothetical protein
MAARFVVPARPVPAGCATSPSRRRVSRPASTAQHRAGAHKCRVAVGLVSYVCVVLSIASAVVPETLISGLLKFVSAALRPPCRQSTIFRRVADRAEATRVSRRVLRSALAPPVHETGQAGRRDHLAEPLIFRTRGDRSGLPRGPVAGYLEQHPRQHRQAQPWGRTAGLPACRPPGAGRSRGTPC